MAMHPSSIDPVPEDTARVARAAFRKGTLLMRVRDEIGVMYDDAMFATLYDARGQSAIAPWRLALVTLFQFLETLSDRQAAEAVRSRIDWKDALSLELTDPGFDFSALREVRARLLGGGQDQRLLEILLERLGERGLVKARGKQRTDSTHVLAAICTLNRLEFVGETRRAALHALAQSAPAWLARRGWPSTVVQTGRSDAARGSSRIAGPRAWPHIRRWPRPSVRMATTYWPPSWTSGTASGRIGRRPWSGCGSSGSSSSPMTRAVSAGASRPISRPISRQ
jgi:transposase